MQRQPYCYVGSLEIFGKYEMFLKIWSLLITRLVQWNCKIRKRNCRIFDHRTYIMAANVFFPEGCCATVYTNRGNIAVTAQPQVDWKLEDIEAGVSVLKSRIQLTKI
jgi:hypothetical protein